MSCEKKEIFHLQKFRITQYNYRRFKAFRNIFIGDEECIYLWYGEIEAFPWRLYPKAKEEYNKPICRTYGYKNLEDYYNGMERFNVGARSNNNFLSCGEDEGEPRVNLYPIIIPHQLEEILNQYQMIPGRANIFANRVVLDDIINKPIKLTKLWTIYEFGGGDGGSFGFEEYIPYNLHRSISSGFSGISPEIDNHPQIKIEEIEL